MDDTTKSVAIGLVAALLLHGFLQDRARQASVREMREAFPAGGEISARVVAEPPLYLFGNRIQILDLYGTGVSTDRLPFMQYPRTGWKGSIHSLRLHIKQSTLKGLSIEKLEAEIPNVRYDLGWAMNRNRLKIRSAGTGTLDIWISTDAITEFTRKKYARSMRDVQVSVIGDRMAVRGTALLMGAKAQIDVQGSLVPKAGRYVEIENPQVSLNGKLVAADAAARLISGVNPVLDVDKDFDIGNFMRVESVKVEGALVHIHGSAAVPVSGAVTSVSLQQNGEAQPTLQSSGLLAQ
jgi:LmeA-like phospholipid-binding